MLEYLHTRPRRIRSCFGIRFHPPRGGAPFNQKRVKMDKFGLKTNNKRHLSILNQELFRNLVYNNNIYLSNFNLKLI